MIMRFASDPIRLRIGIGASTLAMVVLITALGAAMGAHPRRLPHGALVANAMVDLRSGDGVADSIAPMPDHRRGGPTSSRGRAAG